MGRGLGLIGIRERLQDFRGTLRIDSAPGRGTTLAATIPLMNQKALPREPPFWRAKNLLVAARVFAPRCRRRAAQREPGPRALHFFFCYKMIRNS